MRSAGLFDIQVNGFAGVDFNDAALDPTAFDHALEAMIATGVTACLPTIITAPAEVLAARLEALDRAVARSALGHAMVPGYHLEGPFLNPGEGFRGCHPPEAMTPPDAALLRRLQQPLKRPILLVTVAPEREGSEDFIREMVADGRVVAIGHADLDAEVVERAASAGASLSTHLGNAMPHLVPKLANPLFAQLAEDRLAASVIADGIHAPPYALKAMIRAKGFERTILVTDAVSAAGAAAGLHAFAGMQIERAADGSVRVPGSTRLAGSALTLDGAVRNIVAWDIAPLEAAIVMAGENPHRLMAAALARLAEPLEPGLVEWSSDLQVRRVRFAGRDFAGGAGGGDGRLGHGAALRLGGRL